MHFVLRYFKSLMFMHKKGLKGNWMGCVMFSGTRLDCWLLLIHEVVIASKAGNWLWWLARE